MLGLIVGCLTMFTGVFFALAAALQGQDGGATALVGMLAVLPLALLSLVVGGVGAIVARERRGRGQALVGVGLGVLGPVVFVALLSLLVPANAFRI